MCSSQLPEKTFSTDQIFPGHINEKFAESALMFDAADIRGCVHLTGTCYTVDVPLLCSHAVIRREQGMN